MASLGLPEAIILVFVALAPLALALLLGVVLYVERRSPRARHSGPASPADPAPLANPDDVSFAPSSEPASHDRARPSHPSSARSTITIVLVSALVLFGVCSSVSLLALSWSMSTLMSRAASEFPVSPEAMPGASGDTVADRGKASVLRVLEHGGVPAVEERFGKPAGSYAVVNSYGLDLDAGITGYYRPGGGYYGITWGFNSSGSPVVIAHTVEATAGAIATPLDRAFVDSLSDGHSSLASVNDLLSPVVSEGWEPIEATSEGVKVPAYLWQLPDRSGFLVEDYSGLTTAERAGLHLNATDLPFSVHFWDSSHFIADDEPDS